MKIPKIWESTSITAKSAPKKKAVTARIDMSEEIAGKGLCPECHEPMKPVIANGIRCLCCMEHRIVLPVKNE